MEIKNTEYLKIKLEDFITIDLASFIKLVSDYEKLEKIANAMMIDERIPQQVKNEIIDWVGRINFNGYEPPYIFTGAHK